MCRRIVPPKLLEHPQNTVMSSLWAALVLFVFSASWMLCTFVERTLIALFNQSALFCAALSVGPESRIRLANKQYVTEL
jgi:hypothetical protein